MYHYEIHAGEGGEDAAMFADELADAVGRLSGVSVDATGRVVTVASQRCL